jgi:hypothetical protein
VVVVLSADEYHRLQADLPDFKHFLMEAPDFDRLEIRRDRAPARTVDLSSAATEQ